MSFSPIPSYVIGTMFLGIGVLSLVAPEADYAVFGLPLEGQAKAKTDGAAASSTTGTASPMVLAKGARDLAFGLTYVALQYRGLDEAITVFSAVLCIVALSDGAIVWQYGGPALKSKAWSHWGGLVAFAAWVAWRAGLF
ncbi:uncharacterized protein SPSK_06728 [Sporothrix schenckii 1099-18]|nr:uncharacterized protein SPSK_06728 [Sporothrix schenckii 1099-18]KJR90030.1 hypothetical protein SPSK_06728 [Sporothrix schenckii 1099-18]